MPFLKRDDAEILATFKEIVLMAPEYELDKHQLIRIGLPMGKGGYGLRPSTKHAKLAYYASLHESIKGLEQQPGAIEPQHLDALISKCSGLRKAIEQELKLDGEWDSDTAHLQRKLSEKFDELQLTKWKRLIDRLPFEEAKRHRTLCLGSAAEPDAALWLDCGRGRARSNWNREWDSHWFGMAVQFTLGVNLFRTFDRCVVCRQDAAYGDHYLHALHGKFTQGRTQAVLKLLSGWIKRFFGVPVRREDRGNKDLQRREGDISFATVMKMPDGRLFIDHTCRSDLAHQDATLKYAEAKLMKAGGPHSLASDAEEAKMANYVPGYKKRQNPLSVEQAATELFNPCKIGRFDGVNCYFYGISSSLFGGLGPRFKALIELLAKQAYNNRTFKSFAQARRSLIGEMVRTQMEHCMMTLSDYQTGRVRPSEHRHCPKDASETE